MAISSYIGNPYSGYKPSNTGSKDDFWEFVTAQHAYDNSWANDPTYTSFDAEYKAAFANTPSKYVTDYWTLTAYNTPSERGESDFASVDKGQKQTTTIKGNLSDAHNWVEWILGPNGTKVDATGAAGLRAAGIYVQVGDEYNYGGMGGDPYQLTGGEGYVGETYTFEQSGRSGKSSNRDWFQLTHVWTVNVDKQVQDLVKDVVSRDQVAYDTLQNAYNTVSAENTELRSTIDKLQHPIQGAAVLETIDQTNMGIGQGMSGELLPVKEFVGIEVTEDENRSYRI